MTAKLRLIAAVSLLVLVAGAALAGSTAKTTAKPAAGVSAPTAAPTLLQAAPAPATTDAKRPALTTDQKALEDIMQRGQAEVATLVQGLQSMPLGPAREGIERKIVEAKLRYRVEFLRTLAGQQRVRGDLAAALTTDDIVEQLLHPKPAPVNTEAQTRNRPGATK